MSYRLTRKFDPFRLYFSTPEQAEMLERHGIEIRELVKLRPFVVGLLKHFTGFWNGTARSVCLLEARKWASATNHPLYYVEMDLRNVGGANRRLGHSQTNALVYHPLTEIVYTALTDATHGEDTFFVPFAHGGDEFSAIIGGVSNAPGAQPNLTAVLDGIVRDAAEYSLKSGLWRIPHPKHPFRVSTWGIGLAYGLSEFRKGPDGQWLSLKEMFSEADRRVESYKSGIRADGSSPFKLSLRRRLLLMTQIPAVLFGG